VEWRQSGRIHGEVQSAVNALDNSGEER